MDIKEFAQDFMESVKETSEMLSSDFETELADSILEYIQDSGEIGTPDICSFSSRGSAVTACDYNVDSDSLDLFLLLSTETILGKINDNKLDEAFSKMYRFYSEVLDGKILKKIDNPNDEIAEIASLIKSTEGKIHMLRLFVITNGIVSSEYDPSIVQLDNDIIMEHNVWDIQRIYQQHSIKTGKEKIEIDFPAMYNTELQCIKMNDSTPDVDAYLAIIPGVTLAQIYRRYQQGILESNVRTFLQFKAKVNRGIHETLRSEPEMFFSYNNGISSTATDVTLRDEEGQLYITNLYNWQIVNGGQTTASIAATYTEKGVDLSRVYVPMKVSIIHNDEQASKIIANISRYANSQTAVKTSDFSSNDPYLVKLEQFSRNEWVPNKTKSSSSIKWYFERTRGQYLVELGHQKGINEKIFRNTYPKSLRLQKTDIAKFEMCWSLRPYIVCRGAEKNYVQFVEEVKKNPINVTSTYYHWIVAKAILFRTIDNKVKKAELGGYKSNMNAYLLSAISLMSNRLLDLNYIWENQEVPKKLIEIIDNLIPIVWNHLTSTNNSGMTNVGERSKQAECWSTLKVKLDNLTQIPEELRMSPETMIDGSVTEGQKEKINKAWEIDGDTWMRLAAWAKSHDYLTPLDRKMAFSFGQFKNRNRMFTFKQAMAGLRILSKATELGFDVYGNE